MQIGVGRECSVAEAAGTPNPVAAAERTADTGIAAAAVALG